MTGNYRFQRQAELVPGAEPPEIITRFERIPASIFDSEADGAQYVAGAIAEQIRAAGNSGFVLGLTTGKTPVGVYRKLVEMYRAGEVSFADVTIFSLDEFYPMTGAEIEGRGRNIREDFIDHVDLRPENIFLLDPTVAPEEVAAWCHNYEKTIAERGGIDLMILGVGVSGQIGFNQPGCHSGTRTRPVALGVREQRYVFGRLDNVPRMAITMGIGTVLSARRIILMAWSEEKTEVVGRLVEGEITASLPASYLQAHPNIEVVVDENAAGELTRVKTPWLVGTCNWTPKAIRKAVIWLCGAVGKPILKLTYGDYTDNSLGQLLDGVGAYDQVNIRVFNDMQHTISGWPGGKPGVDDSTRPERSLPFPKRVVIFSPHPDDDVISMGGTFLRLVDQGHDVHVAYQTSGNIAVHDDVVLQNLDTARECGMEDLYDRFRAIIASKQPGQPQPEALLRIKSAIRRAEAKAACRHFGLNDRTNVHFLNLPFYETGGVKKGAITDADIDIVIELLQRIRPHQIYAAGDLSDPHGTHRVCIEAVLAALERVRGEEWMKDCRLWLYRGAWQEWGLDMVDMAVPLSPDEVIRKRHAIYRHLSQKDIVPFPGEDSREFWQRAEERTQHTAELYNRLGMAEYQAIEVFVKLSV
ncbi:MAG: PIG-L family deacetylase [Rikenellaceae bacterium]|jgi:glucosamine-6-phosphate deaminase|nr:PIG-L family deacetylase [Rikenellaceae bacterium]